MESIRAVELEAELRQVKTMADGSVNIVLNIPEQHIDKAQVMLLWLKAYLRVLVEKPR